MSNVFSRPTLLKFEDASASIPLRQLDRAFERAAIRLGEDPGGLEGRRKVQFRRYIAGVDQNDPQQLDRLGDALGALIAEVAASKQAFLIMAAETDGFSFADGAFRPAATAPSSFALRGVEDFASIDDRGRRLHLLSNDRPEDAIGGAKELVESVCRIVLRLSGKRAPARTANLVDVAKAALDALEPVAPGSDEAPSAASVRRYLEQLGAVVAGFTESGISPRHARVAVALCIAFASFVTETYLERLALRTS